MSCKEQAKLAYTSRRLRDADELYDAAGSDGQLHSESKRILSMNSCDDCVHSKRGE